MKPFFLLLLLIVLGTLFATLTRPLSLFTETALSPGRSPKRLKPKRQKASAVSPTTGPRNGCKPSLPGKRWQPATQF